MKRQTKKEAEGDNNGGIFIVLLRLRFVGFK
jgi:hypothetical protein